jgi:1,4-alpha-glucan branching enzyme
MRLPVLFHVDQKLGAWQVGSSTQRAPVAFKLFFPAGFDPQISEIKVAGDFQHLIGGTDNQISVLAARKPLRDLVTYEMHIGDFTDEFSGTRAPLDAVQDKLDHLVDLGINAILFMPWTAWRNRQYDWGYEPFQYFAVEYLYANTPEAPEEKISWLKRLISACHQRGIHVIMDGVFNHVGMEFPYKFLYRDPTACPYTGAFGGQFPGLQDLNFNNSCTQDFIRDVCLYWISNFKIDGIRFDNTVNFNVAGDPRGLTELLDDIQSYAESAGEKNISLILEHLQKDAASLVNGTPATSYWDNALFGQCFRHLWEYSIEPQVLSACNNNRFVNGPDKVATLYLSNHDHSHVTWQAGARDNLGSLKWYRTQTWAIALLTSPGTPLIQHGQEFGEDHWIPEDDRGSGRRVQPRPLRWKRVNDPIGSRIFDLYKRLISIGHDYPGLRSMNFHPPAWENWQRQFDADGFGVDANRQVVIFIVGGREATGPCSASSSP